MSIQPKTNGPSSTPIKQCGNNAVLTSTGAMPAKFGSAVGSSMFARARKVFADTPTEKTVYSDSSSRIEVLKNRAVGKSSTKTGLSPNAPLAFSDQGNSNVVNSALRKCRAGGSVAPPKKGANTAFKSGGGKCC